MKLKSDYLIDLKNPQGNNIDYNEYLQCLLTRCGEGGLGQEIVWIPKEFAKEGKNLEITPRGENKFNCIVEKVYK